MIRAVRDERFKYLRNFNPDKGYYLPLTYREQMPAMRDLLRLRDRGQLTPEQAQWFRESKPLEELFDTEADPHELNNLAEDPLYADKLLELREELDRWMEEIEDLGEVPEPELIASMWPGLEQPVTAAPAATRRYGKVELQSETNGAQLGYQLLGAEQEIGRTWHVYTEPVTVPDDRRLVAVAHRIGYRPSSMVEVLGQ